MGFMGFLGGPLGWVMDLIYQVVNSYGWSIILFTVLVKVAMLPFSIKQQKSTARMQAYQPMIAEINKKWANDRQKQQEELLKLQEEYGFSPMAGCLPTLLTLLVMFGIIDVVYKPLQHILRIPAETIYSAMEGMGIANNYMSQNAMIAQIQQNPSIAQQWFNPEQLERIQNFNFHFMGIDLSQMPQLSLSPEALPLLVFPILSVLTMFLSNITMILQSVFMKLMYDPQKMKEQVLAEIEEKKQAKKRKKQVVVTDKQTGQQVIKEVNEAELIKLRLAKARELDEEKYKDERTTPLVVSEAGKE